MTRAEFIHLLAAQDKRIDGDLIFEERAGKQPNLVMRSVEVVNGSGLRITLHGHYNKFYGSITFTFACSDAGGPICRLDVRGSPHGNAGRTHKHDLHAETDPRDNLPQAHPRPDLDLSSPVEAWRTLCEQARITHVGQLVDPTPLLAGEP